MPDTLQIDSDGLLKVNADGFLLMSNDDGSCCCGGDDPPPDDWPPGGGPGECGYDENGDPLPGQPTCTGPAQVTYHEWYPAGEQNGTPYPAHDLTVVCYQIGTNACGWASIQNPGEQTNQWTIGWDCDTQRWYIIIQLQASGQSKGYKQGGASPTGTYVSAESFELFGGGVEVY